MEGSYRFNLSLPTPHQQFDFHVLLPGITGTDDSDYFSIRVCSQPDIKVVAVSPGGTFQIAIILWVDNLCETWMNAIPGTINNDLMVLQQDIKLMPEVHFLGTNCLPSIYLCHPLVEPLLREQLLELFDTLIIFIIFGFFLLC